MQLFNPLKTSALKYIYDYRDIENEICFDIFRVILELDKLVDFNEESYEHFKEIDERLTVEVIRLYNHLIRKSGSYELYNLLNKDLYLQDNHIEFLKFHVYDFVGVKGSWEFQDLCTFLSSMKVVIKHLNLYRFNFQISLQWKHLSP